MALVQFLQKRNAAPRRNRLIDYLENLTGRDWDLTATLDGRANGVGAAADAFNTLLQRLALEIERSARAAISVSTTAPELARLAAAGRADAGSLLSSAVAIAGASEEVATTLERELARNTQEIAGYSQEVADAVVDCDTFGRGAGAEMTGIDGGVTRLAGQIDALSADAAKIGEIVDVINNISRQTSLLSLNAAIEAARAGEQGRGFAVVADQVRLLAQQTGEATHRVQAIIKSVQSRIHDAVDGVEDVTRRVGAGRAQVEATRERLAGARRGMAQLDERIQSIAAATEQMSVAAQSVSSDVQHVANVAGSMNETTRAVNEMGERLHGLADEMLTAIGIFRLGAHRRAREATESLAQQPALASLQRGAMELVLRQALVQHSFFELLYVTDARGVQVSDNVGTEGFTASYGGSGHGRDWSGREWFIRAAGDGASYVTPVYRSAATGHFCFTVAVPLYAADGGLRGVLGADVRLEALL